MALAAAGPDRSCRVPSRGPRWTRRRREGPPGAAAELAELAAELTVDDPALARTRRFRAACLHRNAGDVEQAVTMLEELFREAPAGLERADILFELAVSQARGPPASIELCDAALAHAVGDDTRSARILALRAGVRLLEADAVGALADAHAAVDKAELGGDPTVLAMAIAYARASRDVPRRGNLGAPRARRRDRGRGWGWRSTGTTARPTCSGAG